MDLQLRNYLLGPLQLFIVYTSYKPFIAYK